MPDDAIRDEAATNQGEAALNWVGSRPVRPDGVDKVTGRAKFGADLHLPGMLVGKVLRSPHPHARIVSIDTSKAEALDGVKAVVTRDDFPDIPAEVAAAGESPINFRDMARNVMAREKALYEGHAVAAVAATSSAAARRALKAIAVEYEVLPHVIDVTEAMEPDAPLLHDDLFTAGLEPAPEKPSNVAKYVEFKLGDTEAGFSAAETVVERTYKTSPVHQAYIEPHACLASVSEDGQCDLWCSTQGHFVVRSYCAKLLGTEVSKIRVTASEIGGGFGGKTVVYLEPLALALSRKSGKPVKMVMNRDEVFRATGPTSGAAMWVKIGATKEGRITAAEAVLKYQAGAFAGSPVQLGAMCAFAPYDLENVKTVGYDVVVNRPKVAAYRAPGAPIAEYAVECAVDELAKKLGLDPVELRLKNAAKEGTRMAYGPKLGSVGLIETLQAAKGKGPLFHSPRPQPGPRRRLGLLVQYRRRDLRVADPGRGRHRLLDDRNAGHRRLAGLGLSDGGRVPGHPLRQGAPDHRRHQRLGLHLPDRRQPGDLFQRHGRGRGRSGDQAGALQAGGRYLGDPRGRRGMAGRLRQARRRQCGQVRALCPWPSSRRWRERPAARSSAMRGSMPRARPPATAPTCRRCGGRQGNRPRHHPSLHGGSRMPARRYIPAYVEGQYQGGAVQGIGWALNEEYIYGEDGRMQNPGFLDYRIPVASDVPMIDTVIVEVPNPAHPFAVKGVGETPIIPPMAAIANAIEDATGIRFSELPMSPPKVLKAIGEKRAGGTGQ